MKIVETKKIIEYPNYSSFNTLYDLDGNTIKHVESYQDGPYTTTEYILKDNQVIKETFTIERGYGQVGEVYEEIIEHHELGYTSIRKKIYEIDDSATKKDLGNFISEEDDFKKWYRKVSEIIRIEEFSIEKDKSIKKITVLPNRSTKTIEKFYSDKELIKKIVKFDSKENSITEHFIYKNEKLISLEKFDFSVDKENPIYIENYIYINEKLIEKITSNISNSDSAFYVVSIKENFSYESDNISEESTSFKFNFNSDFHTVYKKRYIYTNNVTLEENIIDGDLEDITKFYEYQDYKSEIHSLIQKYKDGSLLKNRKFNFENKECFLYSSKKTIFDHEKNPIEIVVTGYPYGRSEKNRVIFINKYIQGVFLSSVISVNIDEDEFTKIYEQNFIYSS